MFQMRMAFTPLLKQLLPFHHTGETPKLFMGCQGQEDRGPTAASSKLLLAQGA